MPRLFVVLVSLAAVAHVSAQTQAEEDFYLRNVSISAGMGVNYHNATDIVDRINGSPSVSQRVDGFKSGVEFFGAVSVPLNHDWVAKAEYVYLLSSYSVPSSQFLSGVEFSYVVHMPSIVAQYVLYAERTYNFRAGVGFGYHFGVYEERLFGLTRYTAQGVGSLLELEGNTALGDDLFAHFGVQARWEFIGDLKDERGRSPLGNLGQTSMHFFSLGARLGMSYYL